MTKSVRGHSQDNSWLWWIVAVAVIVGIYYLQNKPQSSTADKYTACVNNAGKLYDSERQTIAQNVNGYSASEQQHYYQQSANGYTQDVNSCKQLYSQ